MVQLTLNQISTLQQSKVLDFYKQKHTHDDYGVSEIKPNVTFLDFLLELNKPNGDIYELIGVSDSLIRERLFERLSELLNVDYNVIYNIWLNN